MEFGKILREQSFLLDPTIVITTTNAAADATKKAILIPSGAFDIASGIKTVIRRIQAERDKGDRGFFKGIGNELNQLYSTMALGEAGIGTAVSNVVATTLVISLQFAVAVLGYIVKLLQAIILSVLVAFSLMCVFLMIASPTIGIFALRTNFIMYALIASLDIWLVMIGVISEKILIYTLETNSAGTSVASIVTIISPFILLNLCILYIGASVLVSFLGPEAKLLFNAISKPAKSLYKFTSGFVSRPPPAPPPKNEVSEALDKLSQTIGESIKDALDDKGNPKIPPRLK